MLETGVTGSWGHSWACVYSCVLRSTGGGFISPSGLGASRLFICACFCCSSTILPNNICEMLVLRLTLFSHSTDVHTLQNNRWPVVTPAAIPPNWFCNLLTLCSCVACERCTHLYLWVWLDTELKVKRLDLCLCCKHTEALPGMWDRMGVCLCGWIDLIAAVLTVVLCKHLAGIC